MIKLHTIWRYYSPFRSSKNTQLFLLNCYQQDNIKDAEKLSYENCYRFIYYLEHGQTYYQQAAQAPLSIQPILLFYGMSQLIKACLITIDPEYPESSSVLAHGVTSRKKKKKDYEFLYDEIKIQKNGLFPHFSKKMFQIDHLENEKITMELLFQRIPELNHLFLFHGKGKHLLPIHLSNENVITIPIEILDELKMTESRLANFLSSQCSNKFEVCSTENFNIKPTKISLLLTDNLNPLTCSPFIFHLYKKMYYLPTKRSLYQVFPEIMIHYLLLYNLSMVSRYETEWWYELLHTYSSSDFPFIQEFLELTKIKIPFLIFQFLSNQKKAGT